MTIVMAKLTGSSISKPRQPIPYNLWAKEEANREAIDLQFKARRSNRQVSRKELLTLRTGITKELYDKLPEETKNIWRTRAKDAQAESLSSWKRIIEGPASTEPIDRQRYAAFTLFPALSYSSNVGALKGLWGSHSRFSTCFANTLG